MYILVMTLTNLICAASRRYLSILFSIHASVPYLRAVFALILHIPIFVSLQISLPTFLFIIALIVLCVF
jgi:hypothetical protein